MRSYIPIKTFRMRSLGVALVLLVLLVVVVDPVSSFAVEKNKSSSRTKTRSNQNKNKTATMFPPNPKEKQEQTSSQRKILQGLDASEFRHPLDRDLTNLVRQAPFVDLAETAIRRSLSVVEQGLRLDLLSSSIKVSSQQFPELYASFVEACDVLDFEKNTKTSKRPELYVQSNTQANAYTLALRGSAKTGNTVTEPIVVVTSALIDRCTDREIQAIIGHELGHLKCEHSLYLTLGGLVSTPFRNLPFLGGPTEQLLERWRLAAEYTCDRAAMLVAQDIDVVAGAMLKLISGVNTKPMNTAAFIAQCQEYEDLLQTANPLVKASIDMQRRTHPLPVKRVVELERWSRSKEYDKILKFGTPIVSSASNTDAKSSTTSSSKSSKQ